MRSKYGFETSGSRSELMAKIKSTNTKAEIKLRKSLFFSGVRYRINNRILFGKPDIAIKKYKLVIFVDGDFWHGKDWANKKDRIKANREYWIPKIESNMARDIAVNHYYRNLGWTILRFWERDVNDNLESCVSSILECVKK